MQDTESKTKKTLDSLRPLWPDVTTEKGQARAVEAGAAAMVYVALSYGLVTGLMLFTGEHIMGAVADHYELIAIPALNVIAVVLACVLGWLVWKRRNLVAAGIGLAWIVAEVAMKSATAPGRGLVLTVFALLFSINGVRGALAAKRKPEQAAAEA